MISLVWIRYHCFLTFQVRRQIFSLFSLCTGSCSFCLTIAFDICKKNNLSTDTFFALAYHILLDLVLVHFPHLLLHHLTTGGPPTHPCYLLQLQTI